MKGQLVILGVGLLTIGIIGCAKLLPGVDPLVIRAEQTESMAYNTFDEFLKLDDLANTNPTVSKTWQPAHVFAQYLRKPVQSGTNTVPFGIATVLSLDNIKLAYVAGKASSNSVVTAIGVVTTVISQVSEYQSLIPKQ